MYVPLAVLLIVEGNHVPEMLFKEVIGKLGAAVPLQKAGIWAKVGVVCVVTVVVKVAVVAHCPALGVKVYVPLAVLLIVEGNHVPIIPLLDVAGNTGATAPLHIGAIAAKVGIVGGLTIALAVAVQPFVPVTVTV